MSAPSKFKTRKGPKRGGGGTAARAARDIGELPRQRFLNRRRAEAELEEFCRRYFPHRFFRAWSRPGPLDSDVFEVVERVVQGGVTHVAEGDASDGHSTLIELAAIWAALTGRRKRIAIVGPTTADATQKLQRIKDELENNWRLSEEFPEVCVPISKRCDGQTFRGRPTNIVWMDSKIVLPTVAGSLASGAAIVVLSPADALASKVNDEADLVFIDEISGG
jgi:hypothetical protein